MLVGPSHRPQLPLVPHPSQGLAGVFRYLQDLDQAVSVYMSTLVGDTFGFVGAQGISGTGQQARNLRGNVTIVGGATSSVASFLQVEADASYYVVLGLRPGLGTPTAEIVARYGSTGTTSLSITLNQAPGTGNSVIVDWTLIR